MRVHTKFKSLILVTLVGLTLTSAISAAPAAPPDSFDASDIRKAEDETSAKNYDEALQLFSNILKRDPKNFSALYHSGWICNELKRFGEAVGFLQRATTAKSDDSLAWLELALAYSRLYNSDDAIRAYAKAASLQDNLTLAWRGLGDVYFDIKKDYPNSILAYKKALQLQPDLPNLNYRIGWSLNQTKNFNEAEGHLKVAVSQRSDDATAYLELGYCLLNLQQWEASRNALERAAQLRPDSKLINYYLGLAYLGSGQRDQALGQVEKLRPISAYRAQELQSRIGRVKP